MHQSKRVNKKILERRIGHETGIKVDVVDKILSEMFNVMIDSLLSKREINLRGFGIFLFNGLKMGKKRTKYNGKTSYAPVIKDVKIDFSPGYIFTEMVNGGCNYERIKSILQDEGS